jgi:hypothetical protein
VNPTNNKICSNVILGVPTLGSCNGYVVLDFQCDVNSDTPCPACSYKKNVAEQLSIDFFFQQENAKALFPGVFIGTK